MRRATAPASSSSCELLDLYDGPGGSAAQMVEAKRKFAERIAILERQKVDIEDSLQELRQSIVSIDAQLATQKETFAA
jgi:vacuolar-type H+-ATPase subunit I/STV1